MNVETAIQTRIEVREFTDEPVPDSTKYEILDAGRLASSGRNQQHWRFILIDSASGIDELAKASTTGAWIDGADFAVVVLTDPNSEYHEIDAGRAITQMQFAAWDRDVGSCIYTGYDMNQMREDFGIPADYAITAVVGFGCPPFDIDKLVGQKDRKPLDELVFQNEFATPIEK